VVLALFYCCIAAVILLQLTFSISKLLCICANFYIKDCTEVCMTLYTVNHIAHCIGAKILPGDRQPASYRRDFCVGVIFSFLHRCHFCFHYLRVFSLNVLESRLSNNLPVQPQRRWHRCHFSFLHWRNFLECGEWSPLFACFGDERQSGNQLPHSKIVFVSEHFFHFCNSFLQRCHFLVHLCTINYIGAISCCTRFAPLL